MNNMGTIMLDNIYGLEIYIERDGYKQYTIRIRSERGDLLDKGRLFDYELSEAKAIAKHMADNVFNKGA